MDQIHLKKILFNNCVEYVKNRQNTIKKTIGSNKEALHSESKSSAGDKHETGRAMLQLEMEKAGQQLKEVDQMKLVLKRIQYNSISTTVSLGSVVVTENGNYFLGVSIGEFIIDKKPYFVISLNTPIGKLLLGKVKNDVFLFQGKQTKILEVF